MRDEKVSLPRLMTLHPKCRKQAIDRINWIEENKFSNGRICIRVTEVFRSVIYQNSLYAIGRSVKGKNPRPGVPMGDIVTKAKGGSSWHNFGLAFDFVLMYDVNGDGKFETVSWDTLKDFDIDGERDFKEVVSSFKDINWKWGGDYPGKFQDDDHLEISFNYTVKNLYQMYLAGKLIPGTQYVNI